MKYKALKDKLVGYSYIPVVFLFVSSLAFLIFSSEKNTEDLLHFSAKQNATALSISLKTFRSIYTKEVISKLQNSEFSIGHEFHNDSRTIPLPATMTIMLGERIKQSGDGSYASLYSPFPFPWRENSGGLDDSFEKEAWNFLSKNPFKEFYRIEKIEGQAHLRYAKADIMQSSCLNCHNTHPQSPKTDWKLGEVRGILEITQPIGAIFEKGRETIEKQVFTTILSGVFGIFAIILAILSFRHQIKMHESLHENLEKRNSELEQFSYRSSHDLKAPLTSSKRLTQFVLEDIESNNLEDASRNTKIIQQQMEKLECLVTDILDLAKADVNKGNVEPIDFETILSDTESKLSYLVIDAPIKFITSVKLSNETYGERARFTQIIENLTSNAIKYKDDKKSQNWIKAKIYDDNKSLYIEISDNGVGIPSEYQHKLFEMFQRFHPSLSSGSGLGLSIVKKHIDHLQGNITCDTSSEGTRFRIVLPKQVQS